MNRKTPTRLTPAATPPSPKKNFKKHSPNIFKQIHEHYLNQYHFHLKSNITVTRTVAHSLMAGRLASAGLCLFWAGQTFNQKATGVTPSDCECDSRADGGSKRNTLTPTTRPSTSSTNLSTGQKLNKSTAMRLQTWFWEIYLVGISAGFRILFLAFRNFSETGVNQEMSQITEKSSQYRWYPHLIREQHDTDAGTTTLCSEEHRKQNAEHEIVTTVCMRAV